MKPLTVCLVLSLILQAIIAKESADPLLTKGQCTTTVTDSDNFWNGTLSFNVDPDCQLIKPMYSWTIINPTWLNISGDILLELTFINFTKKATHKLNCDQSDQIQIEEGRENSFFIPKETGPHNNREKNRVIEYAGQPKVVCRNSTPTFSKNFTIQKEVLTLGFIRYSHLNNNDIPSFSMTYRFPEYPCLSCNEVETCEENPCLHSENKCETIQEAFRCVTNPCDDNPCENNGTCSQSHDVHNNYTCECPDNFTGRKCTEKKPCADKKCENGGTCVTHDDDIGVCECPHDIWGESCETINDGTFCSPEEDKYNGSKILWNATKSGQTDTQPCPYANGTATRSCNSKDDVPFWAQPDLSRCVSPDFGQLLTDVDTLLQAKKVTSDAILNITSVVRDSTMQNGKKRLYAGDLGVATDTVEKVSSLVKKVDGSEEELVGIAKGCGNAVSSIIDPVQSKVWSFSKKGYLENKITTILRSMEELAANVAEKASDIKTGKGRAKRNTEKVIDSSRSYMISTENLAFAIHVLDRASNFSKFSSLGLNEIGTYDSSFRQHSFLSVPVDVFDRAMLRTSDAYIHMYTAKLTSVATLLAETNSIIQDTPSDNITKQVNSEILSLKVLNVQEDVFKHLKKSVKLSFSLQDSNLSSRLDQKCVFLNMSAMSEEDRWLKKGCYRSSEESNATHVVCYCTHLTNFAVLMDIYDVEDAIDELDSNILTYFTYGGGGLSILGCLISVIVFEFFRLKNERVRIHEQLAITIIMVQIFFLVGIDRTENKYVCMAMAICLHYSLVAMFCWMLVEGAHLYLVLVKVFKSKSYMKLYVAIGWGIPLIVVGISAGLFHKDYGVGSVCWLTKKVLLVAFVPAVGLVIVINSVVLIIVMRIMLTSLAKGSKTLSEERSSIKTGLKAAAVLLPLLGLTWTFGFLSITSTETLVFTYLFTFFNSLQGVFFFVFHCLLSADVQNAYDRYSRRKSQRRKTESSFSKKGTLKRDSEFNSSMYTSSFSKNSIKTATTDASMSLERKRSNRMSDNISESHYPSVGFEDDVFYDHAPSIHGSVSSQISRTHYRNSIQDPILHKHNERNDDYKEDRMLNNKISSSGRRGSNDYILYYGKNNVENNDLNKFQNFDRNDLYSSVPK